jgi:hypothetical protein
VPLFPLFFAMLLMSSGRMMEVAITSETPTGERRISLSGEIFFQTMTMVCDFNFTDFKEPIDYNNHVCVTATENNKSIIRSIQATRANKYRATFAKCTGSKYESPH